MPDTKITALAAITTVDPANDVLPIVDVSDTSMAASGTTKKITTNQILGASGTATLASATISGDLTVDTSTLKVDSANNRVGIGTASPISQFANTNTTDTITGTVTDGFAWRSLSNDWAATIISRPASGNAYALRAHTGGATASDYPLWLSAGASSGNTVFAITGNGIFTFGDGAGGTRMTLNATGLGVGVSPTGYGILALKKDNTSAPPYIVLDNRGTGGTDTNTYTQGGILFGAFRDVSNPAYIASITVERKSAAGGASSTGDLIFGTASTPTNGVATERLRIDSSGNVIVNTAAVATTATDGFLYIPGCAGTPTGTPTAKTGRVPLVVDTTNNKLYFYSGGAWVAAN